MTTLGRLVVTDMIGFALVGLALMVIYAPDLDRKPHIKSTRVILWKVLGGLGSLLILFTLMAVWGVH